MSTRRALLGALALVAALVPVGAGAIGASGQAHPPAPVHPAASPAPTLTAAQKLAKQLHAAVLAKAYPATLSPALASPVGQVKYLLPPYQCINPDDILNTDQCNFGPADAPHSALVLGDSTSTSILPAVLDDLLPLGYHVHAIALSACPNAWVRVRFSFNPGFAARCNRSHPLIAAQAQRLDPDLIILEDSATQLQRLESGNKGADAVHEWLKGFRMALAALSAPGRKIVVLESNPTSANPSTCATPGSKPAACLYTIDPWWFGQRRAESKAAAEFGAQYIDTQSWYADGSTVPMFAGTTTMRWDASHLTTSYSHKVAPALLDAIRPSLATS